MTKRLPLFLVAALSACSGIVPSAAAQSVSANYEVRWLGVRIANATVTGEIANGSYRLALDSSYSLVIASGSIAGRVTGRLSDGSRLAPQAYSLASTGEPRQRSEIAFEGNTARRVSIEPPLPANWHDERVPMQPQHSRNVLDPMSSFVFAALRAGIGGPDDGCRSTIPVFTGVSRFDVVLAPIAQTARTVRASTGSREQAPTTFSCRIRFVPIAGHRPGNSTVRALQGATDMRVDFDQEMVGPVRMPRRIEIPTRWGTVSIRRT